MHSIATFWAWAGFAVFIIVMLFIDLFLLGGRRAHVVSIREGLAWTTVWISLALLFNLLLWWYLTQTYGPDIANTKSIEFLTGYLIEKSLSVDNIFVIAMIFNYFSVPMQYQKRILFYGVLGAIVMRLVFILFGIWLINMFHWILYVFGAFLVITGLKMIVISGKKSDLSKNFLLQWMRHHLRISHHLEGDKFFFRENGLLYATPLLLVLVFVEFSDVIFAIDSIPAIFAITRDPFIVFSSNIFAILGLRSLYFVLQGMLDRFELLHYGLALVLILTGLKMLIEPWFQIPIFIALIAVVLILGFFMALSMFKTHRKGLVKNHDKNKQFRS